MARPHLTLRLVNVSLRPTREQQDTTDSFRRSSSAVFPHLSITRPSAQRSQHHQLIVCMLMTSSCFFIDCCSLCILLAVRSVRTTNAILRQQFKDHLSTEDDHQEDHVTLGSPETSEFQSCYGPEEVEMLGVHIAIFSRFEYANYQE